MLHRIYKPGRYLCAWADKYGIEGEGFAPLSMPGHHFITKAALEAVPEMRAWLGPEAELLTWTYCGFPDMNWHAYGHYQAACEHHPEVRYPDTRREWEIPRYCDYNDLTKSGEWFGHTYPDAALAAGKHYRRVCAAGRQRRSRDAVRLLGAMLHYLEDCGAPPHAIGLGGPLHLPAENIRTPERITIAGYRPRPIFDPAEATKRVYDFAVPRAHCIVRRLEKDPAADVLDLQLECANACAEVAADALAAFHRQFASSLRFRSRPARRGVELLYNGNFMQPDDEAYCPAGWVMKWWDRKDRNVVLERRNNGQTCFVMAENVVAPVACMLTWTRALRVHPGEVYAFSAKLAADDVSDKCGLYAEMYDGATCKVGEWHVAAPASTRWRQVAGRITVPERAALMRVGVAAQDTAGPVRFTSLSLMRQ
ncbi:MAG: hypothetical protein NT011_13820 [Kiritimatiellaeota bacterium]|nr:hypothetical protein [Kiritimatiellota bacterium]